MEQGKKIKRIGKDQKMLISASPKFLAAMTKA